MSSTFLPPPFNRHSPVARLIRAPWADDIRGSRRRQYRWSGTETIFTGRPRGLIIGQRLLAANWRQDRHIETTMLFRNWNDKSIDRGGPVAGSRTGHRHPLSD